MRDLKKFLMSRLTSYRGGDQGAGASGRRRKVLGGPLGNARSNGPRRSTNEYRVQRRDSEIRWVRVCRLASREGAGRERRMASLVGTVEDITEHKEWAEREHFLKVPRSSGRGSTTRFTASFPWICAARKFWMLPR
jgi:hypothetical protein